MKKQLFFSLILILGILSCQKSNEEQPFVNTALKSAIVEQNNSFSIDIFSQMVKNDETEQNVFISPMSMYYALGMAGMGAAGVTREEFDALLGWQNLSDSSLQETMKSLNSDILPKKSGITLEIANSLWQSQLFPIKAEYKSTVEDYFNAEASLLDFADPNSVDVINNWIANKTHDRIKDMLDAIPAEAVLYLINAIYFKGDWKYQFDEKDNRDFPFYKANQETLTATFMRQKSIFKYQTNDICSSITLPYSDSTYYMVLLLPTSGVGIDGLMNQLSTETWKNWEQQMEYKEVEVTIPKFKFEYGTRLINDELQELGLVKAFSPFDADFANITDESIFISRVLHKAFIEVNETGSEAAAATIVEFEYTSAGPDNTVTFTADRPFIFAICHQTTNSILFMGKVAWPEQ